MALANATSTDDVAVLDPIVAEQLERRFLGSFRRDIELDAVDTIAIGVAGAVGAAVDLLLVAIPKDVTYLGQHPQAGSVLTKLFKSWSVPSDNVWARGARVPFDHLGNSSAPGMFPGNHRFITPGHDPVLGFIVGVLDILRGGRTAIGTDGVCRFQDGVSQPVESIAAAIVLELMHLLSDVATSAGLPAPFMTVAGLLRIGSFGPNDRTVADLARYMYLSGYDLRHFVTTCSTPAVVRLLLCGYFLARQSVDADYRDAVAASARKGAPLNHPKLVTMTFLADAVACAANVGKIALYQGNPSAFNYAQWLALIRSSSKFVAGQMEPATQILMDRGHANNLALQRRWEEVGGMLGDLGLKGPSAAF